MLQQLVSLGALEFRTEPLDDGVERRFKTIWEQAPCPERDATAIRTWDDLDRLDRAYNTVHSAIRDVEAAFQRGFPVVWDRIGHTVNGPTQVDETQQVCSGFKGSDSPRGGLSRGGSPEGGRTRWSGE